MKIKLLLLILILAINLTSSSQNINLIPMYGNASKTDEQINADNKFYKYCDKNFKSRKEASKYFEKRGWDYFYANKLDTSMMRFNQAWMLDSLNSNTYWGFANLLGSKGEIEKSIPLFNKAIELDKKNPKLLESASTSYLQLWFKTKNDKYIEQGITLLKQSISIDDKNGRAFGQLAIAYYYKQDFTNAKKYFDIAMKLSPNSINPQAKEALMKL